MKIQHLAQLWEDAKIRQAPRDMEETFRYAWVLWHRAYPQLSEEETLADLWGQGFHNDQTFAAFNQRRADAEDERAGVIKHPDQLRGWHVGWARETKPGVLQFMATRTGYAGVEMMNGFVSPDLLRVAIETHVIEKPNGYMMP